MTARGLFLNCSRAEDSIYESGLMFYENLKKTPKAKLEYIEVSRDQRVVRLDYDFYIFNYHKVTMNWLKPERLRRCLRAPIMTIVLEVYKGDPFVMVNPMHFDAYLVLDPTTKGSRSVFPFTRPLDLIGTESLRLGPRRESREEITIGSFGFATEGKGFDKVVEAVCLEFDRAHIRFNIPNARFLPNFEDRVAKIKQACFKMKTKAGVTIEFSHHYFNKQDLVSWCHNNDLNCFLYTRDMPGLSATTDQAIVADRPLAVSDNPTFAHVTQYITPYPQRSLTESLNVSLEEVRRIQKAWSVESFQRSFEDLMVARPEMFAKGRSLKSKTVKLPAKTRLTLLAQHCVSRIVKH